MIKGLLQKTKSKNFVLVNNLPYPHILKSIPHVKFSFANIQTKNCVYHNFFKYCSYPYTKL
jgi:hypothetical protein